MIWHEFGVLQNPVVSDSKDMTDMTHDQPAHELGVIEGNPFYEALFEQPQQEQEDCMEASIADVINEMGHGHVTDENIAQEAEQTPSTVAVNPFTGDPLPSGHPMYAPGKGSFLQDAPTLLASHGVQAIFTDDQTAARGGPATDIAGLQQQLNAGHHVLVGVDAEKIWSAIGLPTGPDGNHPDHVVEVTGIDTDKGVVYLNDTGNPHSGAAEAVDINVFEQAWALSQHEMVASTDADPAAANPNPMAVPGTILPMAQLDPFSS